MPSSPALLHRCSLVSIYFLALPFLLASSYLYEKCFYTLQNGLQQIGKCFDLIYGSNEVTKILLVKDHARNGKESFCVKKPSRALNCATSAVSQFNRIRR